MARENKNQRKKRMLTMSIIVVLLLLVGGVTFVLQGFALVPSGGEVWIPSYGTVACAQTRLECFPGSCDDPSPDYSPIPREGASYWCGEPTVSDANYYEGCDVFIQGNDFLGISSLQRCAEDGTQCRNLAVGSLETSTLGGKRELKLHLEANEKVFVNPNLASYGIRIRAPVYGIRIEGETKPVYADRCNLAQAMSTGQIAVLKNSPDYAKTVAATSVSPGQFPVTFITGYKQTIHDQRIVERDGESWFIADIGLVCAIERDTNNRYVVTDECETDADVQCFPNIGNCDRNGRLIKETGDEATAQKSCVPGTLVGSTTDRIPVSREKACRLVCGDDGVPKNADCVEISKCTDGKVLSQDYECVDSTRLSEKELCEANDGEYTETRDEDGKVTATCDYRENDNFLLIVGLVVLALIVLMLLVKLRVDANRRG